MVVAEINRCSKVSEGSSEEVEESSGEDTPRSIGESDRELGRRPEGTTWKPVREFFTRRLPEEVTKEKLGRQAR